MSLLVVAALLQGCVSPASDVRFLAREYRFDDAVVRADGFDHQVYLHRIDSASPAAATGTLHIYLEGDGQPWQHRIVIMPDPTPRNPLMLRLMRNDPEPSAYVGRPCYYGHSQDPGCTFPLWTSARFSETVVASMAEVIRVLQGRYRARELWLIGHSGGGALAMLLAERLPAVSRVVTLGANLDTDAWTRHHRYSPLRESFNPAQRPALRQGVRQWHLLGTADRVVPPALVTRFIRRQPAAVGIELAGFTHSCCWSSLWPELLDSVRDLTPGKVPGEIIHRGRLSRRPTPEPDGQAAVQGNR